MISKNIYVKQYIVLILRMTEVKNEMRSVGAASHDIWDKVYCPCEKYCGIVCEFMGMLEVD